MDEKTAQFWMPCTRTDSGGSGRVYLDASGSTFTGNPAIAQGDGMSPTMHLKTMFQDDFPSLIPATAFKIQGLCNEEMFDVLTLAHRFERSVNGTGITNNSVWTDFEGAPDNTADTYYNFLRRSFMYYSGGLDYKIFLISNTGTQIMNMLVKATIVQQNQSGVLMDPFASIFARSPVVIEDFAQKGVLEINVPYVERLPYWSIHFPSTYKRENGLGVWQVMLGSATVSRNFEIWRACADDFSVGHFLGAPILVYGLTPAKNTKQQKLITHQ